MQRYSAPSPFDWLPALRSPVAVFAAVVAASVAFTVTHLLWLGEYVAP